MKHRLLTIVSLLVVFAMIVPAGGKMARATDTLYSISGRVTDTSGTGVSGVTITATDITAARTSYDPHYDKYGISNLGTNTSWEIFVDTFTEEVVYTPNRTARLAALDFYHYFYKCDEESDIECHELGSQGICDGMAASNLLIEKGWEDPFGYLDLIGKPTASDITEFTDVVKNFLVRYQGYQLGWQVFRAKVLSENRTLSQNEELIRAGIDNNLEDPYLIIIRGPHGDECAGHTLVPYAYWQEEDSYHYFVYDPNHPEISNSQVIIIDPLANSWYYDHQNPIGIWQSGQTCAENIKSSLNVIPVSAYQDHPLAPWFGSSTTSGTIINIEESLNSFIAGTENSLLIQDDLDRSVGLLNGQLVFEIPGSFLNIPSNALPNVVANYPDEFVVPGTLDFDITLTNHISRSLSLFGILPGGFIEMVGSSETDDPIDHIFLTSDLSQIQIQPDNPTNQRSLAVIREFADHSRSIEISQFEQSPGQVATFTLEEDNSKISFSSTADQDSYQFHMQQAGISQVQFIGTVPGLTAGDIHTISLDWENPEQATVQIDQDGDGTPEEVILVENQIRKSYLPLVTRTGGIVTSIMYQDSIDSQDLPEVEVPVINATTYTAETDANGFYTITNLPFGAYSVIPSLTDNTFTPTSLIVIRPSGFGEFDFTCTNCGSSPGERIYIPAGEFQMGCDPEHNDVYLCGTDEVPLHSVYLDSYFIDVAPVTNARYAQCVVEGICTAPLYSYSWTRDSYYGNQDYSDYPVIYIDWYQAMNFCNWTGGRLPTEAEWEKAARGSSDTRMFPWGDQWPDCTMANIFYNYYYCVGDTSAIGDYPSGASPYGLLDVAGNVSEWVNDWYSEDYYFISPYSNPTGPDTGTYKVVRGGSWRQSGHSSRVASRSIDYPMYEIYWRGIRCAYTP